MSMNIKSAVAHQLARELAERTGETITEAVTVALRDRLRAVAHRDDKDAERFERLREISMRTAPRMGDGPASTDLASLLYDDAGLPR